MEATSPPALRPGPTTKLRNGLFLQELITSKQENSRRVPRRATSRRDSAVLTADDGVKRCPNSGSYPPGLKAGTVGQTREWSSSSRNFLPPSWKALFGKHSK